MVLMVMVLVMEKSFFVDCEKKEKPEAPTHPNDHTRQNYSSLAQTTQPAEGKSVII